MSLLSELKKDTLKSYMDKAQNNSRTLWSDRIRKQGKERVAAERKYQNRDKGIEQASKRVYETTELTELLKHTLSSYVKKASADKYSSDKRLDSMEYGVTKDGQHIADTLQKRLAKREKGISSAKAKLKEDTMQLTESQQTAFDTAIDTVIPVLLEQVAALQLDESSADALVELASTMIEDALFTVATEDQTPTPEELTEMVNITLALIAEELDETEIDLSIPSLLAMVELDQPEDAKELFANIMDTRLAELLADTKASIAKSLFASPATVAESVLVADVSMFMEALVGALDEAGMEYTEEELISIAEEVSKRTADRKSFQSNMKTWDAQDAEHKRDWSGAAKHWKSASLAAIHGRAKHTQKSLSGRAKVLRQKSKMSESSEVLSILTDVLGLNQLVEEQTMTTDDLQALADRIFTLYSE